MNYMPQISWKAEKPHVFRNACTEVRLQERQLVLNTNWGQWLVTSGWEEREAGPGALGQAMLSVCSKVVGTQVFMLLLVFKLYINIL